MLTDEQIKVLVGKIANEIPARTMKDEALVDAASALIASMLIALHTIARANA